MKLPNVKKSNKVFIDCNGLTWVYIEEKEIFLVNKDGMQIIKFDNLDEETLQYILEEETHDLSFEVVFNR